MQEFSGNQYQVNNLIPFTDYTFTVHACTGAGTYVT